MERNEVKNKRRSKLDCKYHYKIDKSDRCTAKESRFCDGVCCLFESKINNMINKDIEKIIGLELFYHKSTISHEKTLEIANWFDNLTNEEKEFILILRQEAIDINEYLFKDNDPD